MAVRRCIAQQSVGEVPEWLVGSLRRIKIVCAHTRLIATPLAGGVSSDIYRVELADATICVKRALPKLKVTANWRVPPERNRNEVEWLKAAGAIVANAVPRILAEDAAGRAFAMSYLPADSYPNWKERLRDGEIDIGVAAAVGDLLGRIHAATASDPAIARRFANDAILYAIRLEPYLVAT